MMKAGSPRQALATALPAAALLALAGCHDAPTAPASGSVSISNVDAIQRTAPENVLSAPVVFQAQGADSVRIAYAATGGPRQETPLLPATDAPDTIVLLGLRPSTTYSYRVEAVTGGETSFSDVRSFKTAALPQDLHAAHLDRVSGSASRYALTTVGGRYAVAFDSTGDVAWYHDFGGLPVSNALRQPNGDYTVFVGTTTGWAATEGYYVEITPEGRPVRTWTAPPGEYTDDHDLLVNGSGSDAQAQFFAYTIRSTDLTPIGGLPGVALAGHEVLRVDAGGSVLFRWSGWDNIGLDEWRGDDDVKTTRTSADFDHPNSLSLDPAGNYVVSWRNLDQVMALDPRTGDVLWRVGGARGGYTFVGDPDGGFTKQHSAKVLANGDLLVYDNGTDHSPRETRVVEYRLDHQAKTATMVWQYRHQPAIWTQYVGWTERLPNGNTWVAFALAGRVVEVDSSGRTVWEAQLRVNGADGSVYRIVPISTLY
jgi:hypothetical protein